jgi:hypothetical protein
MTTLFPLNMIAELLLNGVWTDITSFVRQRDDIIITGGNSDTAANPQPAQMTLTLDNTDGRFSPTYTGGAYYPYLVRNNQIRLSINDTSSSGNVYNGYRFWGEVPDWPPLTDLSGRDIYVQITASGPLRRQAQGGGEGSALQRYYASLTGLLAPIAYWPCEEDAESNDPTGDALGTGVAGGVNMSVASGKPLFKAVSKFNGSKPIAVVNQSTWSGVTGSFGSSGDDLYIVAGTYQWVASTTTVNCKCIGGGGGGVKGIAGTAVGGTGGGGGEFAQESTLAVTPGNVYTLTVGGGGTAGPGNAGGSAGTASTFAGDSVTVTANPGGGGNVITGGVGAGGSGGTGSANTTHHNGGNGGSLSGGVNFGAGGGGSGGTSAAGNVGGAGASSGPVSGGAAVAGGGKGGNGGDNGPTDGHIGGSPGGGGGGGWANQSQHSNGGNGATGSVELVYTGSGGGTQPNNNVIRFIMWVPEWGGNNGRVILRVLGSGTVAKMDFVYVTGGNIKVTGYNSGGTQIFTSGSLSVGANNQTLMVSIELAKSGTAVAWKLSAIIPGASGVVNSTSGSVASSSMGSVSQVIVDPNGDVTKTALGHISVQYALVPLYQVSEAVNGHYTETGVERFLRLADEQALSAYAEYSEGADHWGFETGTQSWVATNGTVTQQSTVVTSGWPTDGTHSLRLSASGAGNPSASGPTGTSGQPCLPGDSCSMSMDLVCPVALPNVYVGLKFYTSGGTLVSESDTADVALAANQVTPFRLTGAAAVAPATAAFCTPTFGDHHADAASTLLYADNVKLNPAMGAQTGKDYNAFLKEITDLDQGILKEAKTLWGLAKRTRIRLINQSPAVTLDYAQKMLSQGLAPVVDVQNVKNDITVKRKKGSKVQVTLESGTMSVQEPPGGTGRYKKTVNAVASADEQLAALAAQLLLLGTVSDERYPTIPVNLGRCGIAGNPLAPLMSAIAGVEVGDVVQLNNLPFYYPSSTTKQLVVGYTETINAYAWTIEWNCIPYSPYIVVSTNLRRW